MMKKVVNGPPQPFQIPSTPTIPNPEYKGPWKQKKIKNPNYKGKWKAPNIDYLDYKDDPDLNDLLNLKCVATELWQVKSGTLFDNIIICEDPDYAKYAEETWGKQKMYGYELPLDFQICVVCPSFSL